MRRFTAGGLSPSLSAAQRSLAAAKGGIRAATPSIKGTAFLMAPIGVSGSKTGVGIEASVAVPRAFTCIQMQGETGASGASRTRRPIRDQRYATHFGCGRHRLVHTMFRGDDPMRARRARQAIPP